MLSRARGGDDGSTATAIAGLPEIAPGDDLAALLRGRAGGPARRRRRSSSRTRSSPRPRARVVRLADVGPRPRALRLADEHGKDPRARSRSSSTRAPRSCAPSAACSICRTRHGFVCANAGVDASNAAATASSCCCPRTPTRRPARCARARAPRPPAVVIADSFGRAWRHGQCDVAIGIAGLAPLEDWRGRRDARGPRAARDLDRRRRRGRRAPPTSYGQGLARAGRGRARPGAPRDGGRRARRAGAVAQPRGGPLPLTAPLG